MVNLHRVMWTHTGNVILLGVVNKGDCCIQEFSLRVICLHEGNYLGY